MRRLLFFICLILSISSFSQEKRLALVIGNSAYEHGGVLRNPVNDAMAMKSVLTQVGFEVIEHFNLNQGDMKRAIDEFGLRLKNYEIGLFFYAGHGIQSNGNNYLIPVDVNLMSENDVEYDCINAGRVLGKMEDADNSTNIIILDACRNNPFERSWNRSSQGRGLASMDAPRGSILAYSTAPGTTASDGTGTNGLYTNALINNITNPGLSIEDVFKQVRNMVVNQSAGKQTPWESTSLMGSFYFNNDNRITSQMVPQFSESNEESTTTTAMSGFFHDYRDNQDYRWIKIGDQTWMAENLNYSTSKGSWCYYNQQDNCDKYGKLYDWKTASTVCPDGWHLPSDKEWSVLAEYVGGYELAGGKLKESGTKHWSIPNEGATNEFGFNAVPGGFISHLGAFKDIGKIGYWWSITNSGSYLAHTIYITHNYSDFKLISHGPKNFGYSVRCIKDQ